MRDSSARRLDLPAWSETSMRRRLPTLPRGTCSKVAASLMIARHRSGHGADDVGDFLRKRPAIGIAENHPAGACVIGGLCNFERIGGIGLVAIEEMLAIKQNLAPEFPGIFYGFPDS